MLAAPAGAVTITEFTIEPGSAPNTHAPRYIHAGPDGNLWYTDGGTDAGIGRIGTGGEPFAEIADAKGPTDLAFEPDGTVFWVTDGATKGRRLPSGQVETAKTPGPSYATALTASGDLRWTTLSSDLHVGEICTLGPTFAGYGCTPVGANTRLTGLTLGSDGRLWAAGYEENRVRRLAADGQTTDMAMDLPVPSGPARLALGPDGNLWVTMFDASAIDRITPSGARTRFLLPPGRQPNDIALGPDGALWFTEFKGNKIGRMTSAGVLTNEFDVPTAASGPEGITAGPDGAIWFTESGSGKVGRLQLDPAQGGSGGVSDSLAPRFVQGASFSHRRFRVGRTATPKSARAHRVIPTGTVLRYSLSEPAAVTIAIARKSAGRRVGRSCRAPSGSNRGRRHCTRYVKAGALKRRGQQGANNVAFSGRIGRRALRPGSYRARVTARDAAGNVSKPSAAAFTVVG